MDALVPSPEVGDENVIEETVEFGEGVVVEARQNHGWSVWLCGDLC